MLLPALFSLAGAVEAPSVPTREAVVSAVLGSAPALRATRAAEAAAVARTSGAPELAPLEVSGGIAPFAHHALSVEAEVGWMLPGPGMLRARARTAAAGAAMAQAETAMGEVELAARTSQLYDQAWALFAGVPVLDHHAAVLAELSAAAGRRVAAGGGARADAVVMAEMARAEGEEARLRWAASMRRVAAELRRDGPDGAAAALAAGLDRAAAHLLGEAPAAGAPVVGDDPGPVLAPSEAPRPAVAMADAELAMAQQMAAMARLGGRPMVGVMVSYSTMWDDPTMAAMVGLDVTVPLAWGRLADERRATAAAVTAAESRRTAAGLAASADEAAALAMVAEAEAMERLMLERMVPLAEARTRLARAAFEAGAGPIEGWLEAERGEAEAALRVHQARAERRSAEAMVAMARGLRAGMEVR